jgi:hypothetical protein
MPLLLVVDTTIAPDTFIIYLGQPSLLASAQTRLDRLLACLLQPKHNAQPEAAASLHEQLNSYALCTAPYTQKRTSVTAAAAVDGFVTGAIGSQGQPALQLLLCLRLPPALLALTGKGTALPSMLPASDAAPLLLLLLLLLLWVHALLRLAQRAAGSERRNGSMACVSQEADNVARIAAI